MTILTFQNLVKSMREIEMRINEMKEWKNERMKEWKNERMKEWKNERIANIIFQKLIEITDKLDNSTKIIYIIECQKYFH